MRLLDGDVVAGLFLPVGGEGLVVGFVELARRVVGDVEEGRVGESAVTESTVPKAAAEADFSQTAVAAVRACMGLAPVVDTPYLDLVGRDCRL